MTRKAYTKAREHFGLVPGDGLVLHHVDQTLRHTNRKRYNEWRPEDLCVMTLEEHASLHRKGAKNGPMSEEHKKKISAANKGKNAMPVYQYTLDGELVRVWGCINDAVKYGFDNSHISAVCSGKRRQHKNYIWKYVNDKT